MRCHYCYRRMFLLSRRSPRRLLFPRCHACGYYTFGPAHKVTMFLLAGACVYLLMAALRHTHRLW